MNINEELSIKMKCAKLLVVDAFELVLKESRRVSVILDRKIGDLDTALEDFKMAMILYLSTEKYCREMNFLDHDGNDLMEYEDEKKWDEIMEIPEGKEVTESEFHEHLNTVMNNAIMRGSEIVKTEYWKDAIMREEGKKFVATLWVGWNMHRYGAKKGFLEEEGELVNGKTIEELAREAYEMKKKKNIVREFKTMNSYLEVKA